MSSEPESASQGGGERSTQADATNTFSQEDGRDPLSQQPRSSKRSLQYDPFGQDKEKRELRQQYRSLIGSTKDRRTNLAEQKPRDLTAMLEQSKDLFDRIKAPSESVLDSHFLLAAAEMGAQMAKSMKVDTGFDTDEYLKRIARLLGGNLRSVADAQRGDAAEDEVQDPNEMNWDELGRRAAKRTRRAVTTDHLLGPLEVVHNRRAITRKEPLDRSARPVAPQQLQAEDILSAPNETTSLVRNIATQLQKVGGSKGVNLFRFVINPHSFSNTVENLFYVSFLIREGTASLDDDEEGEPILLSCEPPAEDDYQQGVARRQIIMELDMTVWQELIREYNIRDTIIPTRQSDSTHRDTWTGTRT